MTAMMTKNPIMPPLCLHHRAAHLPAKNVKTVRSMISAHLWNAVRLRWLLLPFAFVYILYFVVREIARIILKTILQNSEKCKIIQYTRKNTDVISNLRDTPLCGRSIDADHSSKNAPVPSEIAEMKDVVFHSVKNAKAIKDLPSMMR